MLKTTDDNIFERFFSKVEIKPNDCWLWKGAKYPDGYGSFKVNKKYTVAHRWIFLRTIGTPPEGYVLDHLCKNKSCVNPLHLEPVTNKENILRSDYINIQVHKNQICKKGHPLEGDNLRIKRDGKRLCVTCTRANHRDYYHRSLLRSLNSTAIQST